MKTELVTKIKSLNIEDLIKSVFQYSKYQVIHKHYTENGIAEWPTWFIVVYRGGVLDDYFLLNICEHSSYTRSYFLKEDFSLAVFIDDLATATANNELFMFMYKNNHVGNNHFIEINEMKRMYDYLFENGIVLFEPCD